MLEDEVLVGNEHPIESAKRQNDPRNRLEAATAAQLCSGGRLVSSVNWEALVEESRRLRIRLQIPKSAMQGDECIVVIIYSIYLVKLTLKAKFSLLGLFLNDEAVIMPRHFPEPCTSLPHQDNYGHHVSRWIQVDRFPTASLIMLLQQRLPVHALLSSFSLAACYDPKSKQVETRRKPSEVAE